MCLRAARPAMHLALHDFLPFSTNIKGSFSPSLKCAAIITHTANTSCSGNGTQITNAEVVSTLCESLMPQNSENASKIMTFQLAKRLSGMCFKVLLSMQ